MPLSWNEIKTRAFAFTKEWENTEREEAEAKPFLIEFLNIFGITRKRVATFEHKVKKLSEADGFIDLLWKGNLLVEMKSKGKDLEKAYTQAKEYCHGLKEYDLPKLIMICDFERFHVYDEEGKKNEFTLKELVKHIQVFALLANYQKRTYKEQDPVNIHAAELMGKLHDKLKVVGYDGHALELYLVRLLFCLFADDTSIFEKGIFHDLIELKTNEDGSDLAAHISQLFQILNTPEDKRLKNLDEAINAFPYVNGKLFEETLPMASFDSEMRTIILQSCRLDWGRISPAIFGSLFQSVMDEKARRNLGAHYTSEKNILKLIKPLFLDDLWKEFEACKTDKNKLKKLHDKISKLRFLDPACGCGNFLIIAYRELRLLEVRIVDILLKNEYESTQTLTSIQDYFLVDVDQFYGIEYEEFPSQIAQVAMWLMDHQMNEVASLQFGDYYKRIPLKKSATIVCGNALRTDWQSLIRPYPWEKHNTRFHYILGNPPFIGKKEQSSSQKEDMSLIFNGVNGAGVLDYVTAWYIKTSAYLEDYQIDEKGLPKTTCAFVSTNSITQGEQVSILWNELFNKFRIKIHFAHRTFKWGNEAKGNAAVHVVIVGFSNYDTQEKLIYDYEDIQGEPVVFKAKNITPYLVEGRDFFLQNRKNPICIIQEMNYGSMPIDDGNLIVEHEDYLKLKEEEPEALEFLRPYTGGEEFINSKKRWCIWLLNVNPNRFKHSKFILNRIEANKHFRNLSRRSATNKLAAYPSLFGEIRQPLSQYIIIPKVSSETRKYIPVGILKPIVIASGSCLIIPNSNLYLFGIMTSLMHMVWMKNVCGRMKSDYQYSASIVYNNFPWPETITVKQKEAIEKAAQNVLDIRATFSGNSLAVLYGPRTMPPTLTKAHQALDKAVDLCYRSQPFPNETKRIEFLFELYDKYTAGLFVKEKPKKKVKS